VLADTATVHPGPKPAVTDDDIDGLARCLDEPAPLTTLRRLSRDVYDRTPVPDRVRHLWRYSDPVDLLPEVAPFPRGPVAQAALPPLPEAGAVALLQPGTAPRVELSAPARQAGLRIQTLVQPDPAAKQLGHLVGPEHGLFEALNLATWSAGILVHVPRGVSIPGPLRLAVHPGSAGSAARVLVLLEEGAELTLIEEHRGGSRGTRFIGVSELFVGPNARLRHVLAQTWEPGAVGHLTTRASVDRDADFLGISTSFGGAMSKVDSGARLVGQGARSELVGLVLGEARQRFDHHTVHAHLAPKAWSTIDFRVAVSGRARSAYTGVIGVAEAAPGSEAYQENRNLLLSKRAQVETIPELEILTDDVSCTHGATVAPLDEEQLFYLRSRGLDAAAARRWVAHGFVAPALERLPQALRSELESLVEARLTRVTGGA